MTLIQEWVKNIYKVNSNSSLLPSTYQEVEYITSSTLWPRIDTWVIPNHTTVNQIKFTPLMVTWGAIYWEIVSDSNDYRLFNYGGSIYFDLGGGRISGSSLTVWNLYELELGNFYVKNVWAASNILTGTTNPSYSWNNHQIHLNFDGGSTYSYNTWYYVKIWDNGVQVRNMIPCYRKSDDVVWMYDTINDVFYTNQGSWSFTAWPEVPSQIEKEVKKVLKWTIQVRPSPSVTPDDDWQFPASDLSGWVYPWWTLRTGSFAQWSLGTDWTTVSRSNAACVMYRSISWNFKLQHRCGYFNAEWWWTSSCWVTYSSYWNNQSRPWESWTQFKYRSTTASWYNQGSWIFVDGAKLLTTSQLTSGDIYIDEIVYENGTYTLSLYEDDNGEPGTLLYSQSATSSYAPDIVWVYHEVGTGTATQTNWVKVRYL